MSVASLPETESVRDVYTVSRLNREARATLETGFPPLWVEGELSNLAQPRSGHIYFSLKDEAAQVRCAMFRSRNLYLDFAPENGMQVLVRGRVSLYEARGEFQLVVEHMEGAGDGALRRAFEALKQRLTTEGLFDTERKRPLPVFPRRIGILTSPTGAAIRDLLFVLARRFPAIPVIVYPIPVQGAGAAAEITRMLALAARRAECDVLILARGGGSLEDLWAFNDEGLARAIVACPVPVVTGIGHEVDFTIADFVADRRASTPSAAAELVTPDRDELGARLGRLHLRLRRRAAELIRHQRLGVARLVARLGLQHPRRRVEALAQRLDELELRLQRGMGRILEARSQRLGFVHRRLVQQHPVRRLGTYRDRLAALDRGLHAAVRRALASAAQRLGHARARLWAQSPVARIRHDARHRHDLHARMERAIDALVDRRRQGLAALADRLHGASPLAVLGRGYALVTAERDGRVVRMATQVEAGEQVAVRLAEGGLLCEVLERREALTSSDRPARTDPHPPDRDR